MAATSVKDILRSIAILAIAMFGLGLCVGLFLLGIRSVESLLR